MTNLFGSDADSKFLQDFPFLIDPLAAINNYAVNHGAGDVQFTLDNYNLGVVETLASQASTTLVFVSTDSGEGYITVDGNAGDRVSFTIRLDCLYSG